MIASPPRSNTVGDRPRRTNPLNPGVEGVKTPEGGKGTGYTTVACPFFWSTFFLGMSSMADHLAHAHLTVRQPGPFRPERENDPVRLGDRVRHFLGLSRGEIQHLDISRGDLTRVIMPHLFPDVRRDNLPLSSQSLGDDILDPDQLGIGVIRLI